MTGVFVTAGQPSEPVVLMGQGPAPAGASREHYLAEGLELVPGAGALAAAVPAAVDAWLLLLRDHGTWELADVLSFAVGYARHGHPVLERVGSTIASVAACSKSIGRCRPPSGCPTVKFRQAETS